MTTGVADAIPVVIDSVGQLGTISSSRRFKEDIRDMGDSTDRLLQLRAVLFRYKQEVAGNDRPMQFGLIAEEVAKIFPELVVFDKEGKPYTVRYHILSSMLLNDLQKQHARVEAPGGTGRSSNPRVRGAETRSGRAVGPRSASGGDRIASATGLQPGPLDRRSVRELKSCSMSSNSTD